MTAANPAPRYIVPPEIEAVLAEEGDSHEFESHGLQCLMYRNKDSKIWCGYVLLPEDHPLTGTCMSELDFSVHGGVTFSGHLTAYPDRWAIGFDCNHAWDKSAYLDVLGPFDISGVYRNKSYVISECEYLAKQIANYVASEPVPDTITLPASTYTRLLAIEAAARNALDNSWHIDTPHPDCVCHDWRGCTVLDDKDAAELSNALTPAAPGDKGE